MSFSDLLKALAEGYAGGRLGTPVYRAARLIPQTATQNLFQIQGGNVLMTMIYGIVTVLIGNVVNTLQLQADPTAGAPVVLDAGTYNPQAIAVGTIVSCVGAPGSALVGGLSVLGGMAAGAAATSQCQGWIIPIGTIDLITTANSVTGQMRWAMWYIPLDRGANVIPV